MEYTAYTNFMKSINKYKKNTQGRKKVKLAQISNDDYNLISLYV